MKSASFLKSGFTLLELTIVIAVIGIISTLLYSNWNVSREKARVTEVAKNTRSIKDQLEIKAFDEKPTPQPLASLGVALRELFKLKNSQNVKTTNYFMGANIPDSSIVFHCPHGATTCFQLDDKTYTYSFLVYFIGNSTDCSLDEAVWMESMTGQETRLPQYFYTQKSMPGQLKTNVQRYNRLRVTKDGKTYESNYCALPIKAPMTDAP